MIKTTEFANNYFGYTPGKVFRNSQLTAFPDSTANQTAQYISLVNISRSNSISDNKCSCTQMVCDNTFA